MTDRTIGKLARAGGGRGGKPCVTTSGAGCSARPRAPAAFGATGEEDLGRLRFIRSAQAAGFTLEAIGELIELDATDDRGRVRSLAQERVAALDAKIAELTAARDALRKLARECAGGAAGPCPILAAFERA